VSKIVVTVERTLSGRLAAAYPAARHDVELRVEDVPVGELSAVLAAATTRILASDPDCRKVVFGAPAGDLATLAAAEAAGFRYVVDVDVAEDGKVVELSLLVCEPEYVTHVDMDQDRVPGA